MIISMVALYYFWCDNLMDIYYFFFLNKKKRKEKLNSKGGVEF